MKLRTLSLKGNAILDRGAAAVAAALPRGQLTALRLEGCGITADGITGKDGVAGLATALADDGPQDSAAPQNLAQAHEKSSKLRKTNRYQKARQESSQE